MSTHVTCYPSVICSRRMSACPQCCASSRSTCRYTQRSGSGPRRLPRTMSSSPSEDVARRDASHASRWACWTLAMVSVSSRMNDSPGVAGMPISARDRHVTASSNQTFSTKVACLTRPSSVVAERTSDRRACSSVSPSRQALSSRRCSSMNVSNWACAGWPMTSSANVGGKEDMSEACQGRHFHYYVNLFAWLPAKGVLAGSLRAVSPGGSDGCLRRGAGDRSEPAAIEPAESVTADQQVLTCPVDGGEQAVGDVPPGVSGVGGALGEQGLQRPAGLRGYLHNSADNRALADLPGSVVGHRGDDGARTGGNQRGLHLIRSHPLREEPPPRQQRGA